MVRLSQGASMWMDVNRCAIALATWSGPRTRFRVSQKTPEGMNRWWQLGLD